MVSVECNQIPGECNFCSGCPVTYCRIDNAFRFWTRWLCEYHKKKIARREFSVEKGKIIFHEEID